MSYPQSHPKHCDDDLFPPGELGPREFIPKERWPPKTTPESSDPGLLSPLEVNERWNLNFNLGSVVQCIWRSSPGGMFKLPCLQEAALFLNREIERERKLCE